MKVWARQFNIYLMLAATLGLLCGCETDKPHGPIAALRVHMETSREAVALGTAQTVSVLRADPVLVTVAKNPFLTEANLVSAKIIGSPGGFGIKVRFDGIGTSILEEYTAADVGRHLVIFGQWGNKLADGRWLAAPLITHCISNGVLSFTPDMSHAAANQLVTGLDNVINFNKKHSQ